jgi:2-methylcitrate dehydratase PrpD
MKDGREHRATVNAPLGSGPRGIEWPDVELKLRTLGPDSGKSKDELERLLELTHGFERLSDMKKLVALV